MDLIGLIMGYLLFVIGPGLIILGWIVVFIYKVKCRKVQNNCTKDTCKFRCCCEKAVLSERERAEIKTLLEQFIEKNCASELECRMKL